MGKKITSSQCHKFIADHIEMGKKHAINNGFSEHELFMILGHQFGGIASFCSYHGFDDFFEIFMDASTSIVPAGTDTKVTIEEVPS